MTDYVRILSYVYLYENGRKTRNVGFVKMDGRDGIVKIIVNIRVPLKNELRKLQLMVYNERDGRAVSTIVGDMSLLKGIGEFQGQLKFEDVADCIGMNIYSVDDGERIQFATYFKDTDINIIKTEEEPIYNNIDSRTESIESVSIGANSTEPRWWSDLTKRYCKKRILGDEYQCVRINDDGILLIKCNRDDTYYIGMPDCYRDNDNNKAKI